MLVQRRLPKSSPVFDCYWHFAAERQRIFRQRLLHGQWTTDDSIMSRFRFTNAYRASDRVSQFLIRKVIYDQERDWTDTFFRIVLFKLFNKIETWESLEERLGEITVSSFDAHLFGVTLSDIRSVQGSIYSAAYIMPSARSFGSSNKHVNHMRLLELMLIRRLPDRIGETGRAMEVFRRLIEYPSIGPFLAYQLLTDLSYAPHIRLQESEFVAPGPGALDGMRKCFDDPGELAPQDIIRWVTESQADEFKRREIDFPDLWGRALQLIDCQNLFCEVGKYAREAFPTIQGCSGRTRIKQLFHPTSATVTAWYPPKWGINDQVESWMQHQSSTRLQLQQEEAADVPEFSL